MNAIQTEINVLRVRKDIPMVEMAKAMSCNRKTLYRAFNSPHVAYETLLQMCDAVGSTIEEVQKLVKLQEGLSNEQNDIQRQAINNQLA